MSERNIKRINADKGQFDLSNFTLIMIALIIVLLEWNSIAAGNPIWLDVLILIGGIAVAFAMGKPGKFAISVQRNGFFNTIFGRTSKKRNRRR